MVLSLAGCMLVVALRARRATARCKVVMQGIISVALRFRCGAGFQPACCRPLQNHDREGVASSGVAPSKPLANATVVLYRRGLPACMLQGLQEHDREGVASLGAVDWLCGLILISGQSRGCSFGPSSRGKAG
jgi:hypothetical protein